MTTPHSPEAVRSSRSIRRTRRISIIGDGYGHLFRTNDEGAHWPRTFTDNTTIGFPRTIAIRPSQPSPHVLAGGTGGLSLSTVGGMSWTPRNSGFNAARIAGLFRQSDRGPHLPHCPGWGRPLHRFRVGHDHGGEQRVTADVSHSAGHIHVSAVLAQDGMPGRLFASLDFHIASSSPVATPGRRRAFRSCPGCRHGN